MQLLFKGNTAKYAGTELEFSAVVSTGAKQPSVNQGINSQVAQHQVDDAIE